MLGLVGKKLGMSQIFNEDGKVVPVTIIEVGPCQILEIKNEDKEGYNALKLGYFPIKENKLIKPIKGYFDKLNSLLKEKNIRIETYKIIKEFRTEEKLSNYEVGQFIDVSFFEGTKYVDVTGKSKGKGFQGMIKRHNAGGGKMSHGSKFHRTPGSTGQREEPGRVRKNKRMPGHLGCETVSVQNLEVVKIFKDKNVIMVKGAVPGARNSIVYIKKAVKAS
ncbi:MAG: 50S ribosomal protein L3 [Spirochaetes bacterium]|nr:50S ribosomal protein L3 [Spirochaetota bacterium]